MLGLVLSGLRVPGAVMLLNGMVRYGGRVLLWDKQLMAVARLALLHAEDRPPDSLNEQADLWRFVEVLLGVNDVYARGRRRSRGMASELPTPTGRDA
jgi:hypothetical protein